MYYCLWQTRSESRNQDVRTRSRSRSQGSHGGARGPVTVCAATVASASGLGVEHVGTRARNAITCPLWFAFYPGPPRRSNTEHSFSPASVKVRVGGEIQLASKCPPEKGKANRERAYYSTTFDDLLVCPQTSRPSPSSGGALSTR